MALRFSPAAGAGAVSLDSYIRGPVGAAATIEVGTVTTLSPGASATVTNSGTDAEAVFDFGIPQGIAGAVAVSGTPTINQIAAWTDAFTIKGVSITGLVKGNGASAPTAAVASTDYIGPTSGSVIQKASSGGLADATITDLDTLYALGNWKVDYLNGTGVRTAVALGADKTIYASNGASAAPTMRTAANLGIMEFGVTATLTVGFKFTPYSGGTVSSGTYTPDAANGNYQYYTNNGAHTLAAPAADSAIDILVTNGASAGAITFSGFTVSSNVGDALTTTNTNKFIISIRRINSVATYTVKALQ